MTAAGRREVAAFGALGVVALLAALLVPTYPGYDTYFHLVWGRDGLDFETYAAPTQHPLWVLAAFAVSWSDAGDRILVLLCVLCWVALVWACFRLGRAVFGTLAGVLGALFVASSFAVLLLVARAYVDVPFLALVLWAGALEATRPRRGLPVAALLALAGLLRPEAWVLAVVYAVWLRRPLLLAVGLSAPVLWFGLDLLVTGDPLFSVTSTSALAEELGRERGLAKVPSAFVRFLADTARPPVFLAGVAGLVLLARRRPEGWHVPAALFLAGAATFTGTGVLGLSILPRYLTVPAVALCLLAGYALSLLPRRALVGALAVGAAFLLVKLGSFAALRDELRFIERTHDAVVATATDPRVTACPVSLPTYRLVPDLRYEGVDAAARSERRGRQTRLYVVGSDKAIRRFGQADGVPRRTNRGAPAAPAARHDFLSAARCAP